MRVESGRWGKYLAIIVFDGADFDAVDGYVLVFEGENLDLDWDEVGVVVGKALLGLVFHAVACFKIQVETLHCGDLIVFLLLAHGQTEWFVVVRIERDAVQLELLIFGGKVED